MILDTPIGSFRWIENHFDPAPPDQAATDRRTHGIAVRTNGEIVVFQQGDPAVLFYSLEGRLLRSWGCFPGAHGLTIVEEQGEERLWLVDESTKRVVKTTLDGHVLLELFRPDLEAVTKYVPTWVAVAEERFGGHGDIWVADGYGSSLIYRYDHQGRYLGVIDGSEGGQRFRSPHGIAFHVRQGQGRFYIADRGNQQFQVYSAEGRYLHRFGHDFLSAPCMSVTMGSSLLVPELYASATILDGNDQLVARLGDHPGVSKLPGWPDERENLASGRYNSPHAAAADAQGNIYLAEWIRGGRLIKQARLT